MYSSPVVGLEIFAKCGTLEECGNFIGRFNCLAMNKYI
jgi:hypothetical protein